MFRTEYCEERMAKVAECEQKAELLTMSLVLPVA
jgi:hypothetical protein